MHPAGLVSNNEKVEGVSCIKQYFDKFGQDMTLGYFLDIGKMNTNNPPSLLIDVFKFCTIA